MLFVLTNSTVTFQCYIDFCLHPCIDKFAMDNLDEILTNSPNVKVPKVHVQQVPQRLLEIILHCKAKKFQFGVSEVGFL
jgi:hypothetical protein